MRREFLFLYSVIVVLFLAVGVLAGYVIFRERGGTEAVGHLVAPAGHATAPELPPRGLALAQGWKCMCGSCTDDLLICHCDDPNGAHEIKAALRAALQEGRGDEEIRQQMVAKYGAAILGGGTPAAPQPAPPAAAPDPAAAAEAVGGG